jgi:hypothetical protein
MQKLDARNGQRQVDESVPRNAFIVRRDEEREKESLLLCII